ncbi:MAG TPA: plastocyanin/azurin family copper-binding protein, partial [Conexibacter sp.]
WTNADAASHTATADDGSFDTGTLAQGRSGSHAFTSAGTFAYHCTIHPSMHGTVTVVASTTAAPAPAPAPAAAAPAASAPTLPNTGMDALARALAGLAMLLAGLALRRLAAR